jgi:hypothetical protein
MFVSPPGGTFSGPGTSGTNTAFNPSMAGIGTHTITYMYTDPNSGCNSAVTVTTTVTTCTSIKEQTLAELRVFPNPFSENIIISVGILSEETDFVLINMLSQEITRKRIHSGKNIIDSENIPPGFYFYSLQAGNKQIVAGKLLKE